MSKRENVEVKSLNDELYVDLSIEELEKRLEMQKLHVTDVDAAGGYGCNCDDKPGDGDVNNGCGDY